MIVQSISHRDLQHLSICQAKMESSMEEVWLFWNNQVIKSISISAKRKQKQKNEMLLRFGALYEAKQMVTWRINIGWIQWVEQHTTVKSCGNSLAWFFSMWTKTVLLEKKPCRVFWYIMEFFCSMLHSNLLICKIHHWLSDAVLSIHSWLLSCCPTWCYKISQENSRSTFLWCAVPSFVYLPDVALWDYIFFHSMWSTLSGDRFIFNKKNYKLARFKQPDFFFPFRN